jgi:hypothetical protein
MDMGCKSVDCGDQYLYLDMNAIFEGNGTEKTRSVNTLNKIVKVKVSWGDIACAFVSNNWQWFAGAIVIPLTIWGTPKLWRLISKKQRKKKR